MARALRHAPEAYGLTLSEDGWVEIEQLLHGLARRPEWRGLTAADLAALNSNAQKQRFEIQGSRIRAAYGHSTAQRIEYPAAIPPAILYHGTSPEAAIHIRAEGLRSMRRQYVHLSTDRRTAEVVGTRHARAPVVLTVDAAGAQAAGVVFHAAGPGVWLAETIPPEFVKDLP